MKTEDLVSWLATQPQGPWWDLLGEAVSEYELETGGAETPMDHFIKWLAEWAQGSRRRQRGLMLLTAHRAKGLEFDHVAVLDGGWNRVGRGEDTDSPRRLYYVAMTWARQTFTVARLPGPHPLLDVLMDEPSVLLRDGPARPSTTPRELSRRYRRLGLGDVFLSYAGYRGTNTPVHQAIAELSTGDVLQLRAEGEPVGTGGPAGDGGRTASR